MNRCPLLSPCYSASGINCTSRNYLVCDLYRNSVTLRNHRRNNQARITPDLEATE